MNESCQDAYFKKGSASGLHRWLVVKSTCSSFRGPMVRSLLPLVRYQIPSSVFHSTCCPLPLACTHIHTNTYVKTKLSKIRKRSFLSQQSDCTFCRNRRGRKWDPKISRRKATQKKENIRNKQTTEINKSVWF